ncbi:hypothetical protein E0K99_04530 [Faecalicoccus pleomorphus]|uniref:hypothetical protein n=1 Tax=Faecalicoccus pleomorphus TaxID=1323 RepID=UPI0014312E49|nr:hypothetical protein [Faecalicoccus pleomorphus]NJE40590.1 hypothetical protein [Faecalicoccus pleomorphus]
MNVITVSDWIEIIGIIASLITSVVAIVISVKTLKQNSHMIEESTRPYITIAGKTTNFQNPNFYLVLKNFGSTGATITNFSCNTNLCEYSFDDHFVPFKNLSGTFIAPAQSIITTLDTRKLYKNKPTFIFDIEYKSNKKIYSEHIQISIDAYSGLLSTRASTQEKELKIISYTLQDLVEKLL